MIKINLLIKPPPRLRWPVVGRIALMAGVVGAIGIAAIGWVSQYRSLSVTTVETRNLLTDYQRAAEKLPALQQELDELKRSQVQAESLGRNQRFSQSQVLADLLVTPDRVWLTLVKFEEGGVLIKGEADSFPGAIAYLNRLRTSPLLRAVEERELTTIGLNATRFTYFGQFREGGKAQ